ncbi:MAG: flagellar basal-body rod protein FlgB [Thermoleophilaceae bacterium]|jgi:flagellar basal-body rod protein FlgB|nr:flagellar basal-body rod protein FlgB [Thermoleophilaceae bacterium]
MSLYDITQLGLEAAIRGSATRQTAIAANVANANTPGYRRQDVDFHGALQQAMSAGDAAGPVLEGTQFSATTDASAPMQADGNSVDIDVENSNLAKNGLEYEALVSVARARIEILKAAMGVA